MLGDDGKGFKLELKYGYIYNGSNTPSVKVPYSPGGFNSIFPDMVESQAKNSSEDIYSQFLRCDTDGNKILSKEEVEKFNTRNELNGELGDVEQGNVGDCLLLGQLIALNQQDWGRQIIKDNIKIDDNGNVTMTFYVNDGVILQAVNVEVTADEIKNAKTRFYYDYDNTISVEENILKRKREYDKEKILCDGDKDPLVFELAIEKCLKKVLDEDFDLTKLNDTKYAANKEYQRIMRDVACVLSGHSKHISYYNDGESYDNDGEKNCKIENNYNEGAYHCSSTNLEKVQDFDSFLEKYAINKTNVIWVEFKNNDKKIFSNHCYAIKTIDKNMVQLIDPHDSTKKIEMTNDEFKMIVRQIHVFEPQN